MEVGSFMILVSSVPTRPLACINFTSQLQLHWDWRASSNQMNEAFSFRPHLQLSGLALDRALKAWPSCCTSERCTHTGSPSGLVIVISSRQMFYSARVWIFKLSSSAGDYWICISTGRLKHRIGQPFLVVHIISVMVFSGRLRFLA